MRATCIHSFVYSFICLFIHLFVYLLIYCFYSFFCWNFGSYLLSQYFHGKKRPGFEALKPGRLKFSCGGGVDGWKLQADFKLVGLSDLNYMTSEETLKNKKAAAMGRGVKGKKCKLNIQNPASLHMVPFHSNGFSPCQVVCIGAFSWGWSSHSLLVAMAP